MPSSGWAHSLRFGNVGEIVAGVDQRALPMRQGAIVLENKGKAM